MAEAAAKWEGKVSVKVKGTADQIWPQLADFCNIGKWYPVAASHKAEGEDGQPGLVRYCNFGTLEQPQFTHEKLLSIDHDDRSYTYTITENNNCGISGHWASWKVIPIHGDAENGSGIEWAFALDPIDGWSYESYVEFAQSGLQALKQNLDKAF